MTPIQGGAAATYTTGIPSSPLTVIGTGIGEALAERDAKIADLERRLERLERWVGDVPEKGL